MNPETLSIFATEDDAKPHNKQHENNFFLDREIQETLLAAGDVDMDTETTTSTPAASTWRLLDGDIHPWNSGPGRRTSATAAASTALRSAGPSTRHLRISTLTRNTVNHTREIPFNFRHYPDVTSYTEQYRRDYTYPNLGTSTTLEGPFSAALPPKADNRVPPTTPCQTGRIEVNIKSHSAASVEFQDQRMDLTRRRDLNPRWDTSPVDRISVTPSRDLENPESQTTGPSCMNKFWTFDTSHVTPLVMTTVGVGRTRSVGTEGEPVTGSVPFSAKAMKLFPANGQPIDEQTVKRLSNRVSNLQLPVSGLRALDILTYTNQTRVRLTQKRPLGVSATLPVYRWQ